MRFTFTLLVSTLSVLGALLVSSAEAHPATGIVIDHAGRIYFSDLETVWRIDNRGALSVFRSAVNGRHVHELTLDKEDNLYGAD